MRIARGISIANTSKPISTAIVYDADAAAFFTAASITDNTQKSAVNTLVLSLKSASIWAKMKAVYPLVGGTATSHKYNLKDPRDLDIAFRLFFSGGLTHSSNGILGGGVNGLADTFINPTIDLGQTNIHISTNVYSLTYGTGTSKMHIGSDISSGYIGLLSVSSTLERATISGSFLNTTVTASTHKGFYALTRNSIITNGSTYLTNNNVFNNFTAANNLTSANIKLFGTTSGSAGYSNLGYSFFSIGDTLNNIELTALKNAQFNFQTTLGRQ